MGELENLPTLTSPPFSLVSDSRYINLFNEKIRASRYGLASIERDNAYASGQGNMTSAIAAARAQLELYKRPDVYFDLGTMLIMSSASRLEAATEGEMYLEQAWNLSVDAWLTGLTASGNDCQKRGTLSDLEEDKDASLYWLHTRGSIARHGDAVLSRIAHESGIPAEAIEGGYRTGGVYLATLKAVTLSGQDGVLSSSHGNYCRVYQTSAGPYVNLAMNLRLPTVWTTPLSWFSMPDEPPVSGEVG
jgi:hypothetical protein